MEKIAKLQLENKELTLPVVTGSCHEKGINIGKLRAESKHVTFDPGYGNTGSCQSAITFIDGEKGVLRYRGIPIEDLASKSNFIETSYLLIYGKLPTAKELEDFKGKLSVSRFLHEDMIRLLGHYPTSTHPMTVLSTMVASLSGYYPNILDPRNQEHLKVAIPHLLSKIRAIAAYSYRKFRGESIVYPKSSLSYCENLLYMMFGTPAEDYEIDEETVQTLNMLLILHADHEQNCSTSTVRMVGSSNVNLFASIAAGILALWGPRHGGANQAVVEMLEQIRQNGGDVKQAIKLAKDKASSFRLMGFGHRVYKNYDPRAKVIKSACDRLLEKSRIHDPLLDIAQRLEEEALKDPYFQERKLYPNVDFYSGVIYRALKIPTDMFTVMFAIGRLPGWIAHWLEMTNDPDNRISRPRQIYVGEVHRPYTPLNDR